MRYFILVLLFLFGFFAFADATYETGDSWVTSQKIETITGFKKPLGWKRKARWEIPPIPTLMPWWFDWRNEVPLTEVPICYSQGTCGSCWAWGTTHVLEWLNVIHTGHYVRLSKQEILSCSGSGTCGGGFFAHNYQVNPGQGTEAEFPYVGRDVVCKKTSHQFKLIKWGYVGQRNRNPTNEELKAAIMHYGPIAVTVTANAKMQSYKGGIFNGCSTGRTNHIVVLVGWNDQDGVWLVQNSWGQSWGENGFMRIKYGCSRIGEDATFAEM